MLKVFKRILGFSKERSTRIKISYLFSFFARLCAAFPIGAILYVLMKIVTPETYGVLVISNLWLAFGFVLGSLVLEYTFKYLSFYFGSLSGFETVADERIALGNYLKRLPMGAFSEKNVGEITGVVTTDLSFIENHSVKMLDQVLNGFLSILVAFIFMLVIDWRLAVLVALITVFAMILLNRNQKLGEKLGKRKQQTQGELIEATIEYVQGMSVVKSYNMTGDKSKRMDDTIDLTRDYALDLEKKILPSISHYGYVLDIGIGCLIFFVSLFALNGSLSLPSMFMLLIYVFKMFLPARAMIIAATVTRILDASLDRYESIKKLNVLDKKETDVLLRNHDIEFEDVSFAYDEEAVIQNVSFKIPEKSMTALVGESGCGKTTITNLMARFWDVQSGAVKIGGINVKDIPVDQLMSNISMVFQKVYLFNDTIINNIRLGKPDATEKEVIEAAKKARCHEFISKLENGYETIIGEGGDTISGGEKQRISIARAILKDAPIILLDEATASIDPENEKHIQDALMALVKEKTLVVIAHRLSTIKSADQILVLEKGQLMEQGTHHELIEKKGLYEGFWNRRTKASGWRIGA